MAEYKKHHFVPQFYLRNFRGADGITVFHLGDKRHIPNVSVKDQCQGDYLYGDDPEIEKTLGELENISAEVIRNIIETGVCPKPWTKEHIRLATFISFQHGRTPSAGDDMEEVGTKTMRAAFSGKKTKDGTPFGDLKGVRLKNKKPALASLSISVQHSPIFMDLSFRVILNKSEIEFITSDAPVVLYNQWCEEVTWSGTRGYVSAGLQIFFPISPRHLILFYDSEIYDADNEDSGVITVSSNKTVDMLNRLQLLSVDKTIYYSGHDETRKKIDAFPFEWHWTPEQSVKVVKAVADEPGKELIVHWSLCQNVRLRLPFLRTKSILNRVPVTERPRVYREKAMKVVEELEALEGLREKPDMDKVPKTFKVTEHF